MLPLRSRWVKTLFIVLALGSIVLISGLFALQSQSADAVSTAPPFASPVAPVYLPRYQPNIPPVTDLVFENVPGPDTPTVQELAGEAATNAEAVQILVDYYHTHQDQLRAYWREENDTRLAAFYAMYIIHISGVYGETPFPADLLGFMTQSRAHCGTYSVAQKDLATGLGLTWREVGLSSGWHGWIEVLVDGNWEIFDSTVNVWIDHSAFDLVQGVVRQYRYFYTPLLDIDRPDARLHLQEGYNMDNLRSWMPGLGLFYIPPGDLFIATQSPT